MAELIAPVLGTGRMGSAMARALARTGHDLVLYNRTADRAQPLADELRAPIASDPREAVARADVALTMLTDGAAVEETCHRPGGVLEGVRGGTLLLEMSTVERASSTTCSRACGRPAVRCSTRPNRGLPATAASSRISRSLHKCASGLDHKGRVREDWFSSTIQFDNAIEILYTGGLHSGPRRRRAIALTASIARRQVHHA